MSKQSIEYKFKAIQNLLQGMTYGFNDSYYYISAKFMVAWYLGED